MTAAREIPLGMVDELHEIKQLAFAANRFIGDLFDKAGKDQHGDKVIRPSEQETETATFLVYEVFKRLDDFDTRLDATPPEVAGAPPLTAR